METGVQMETQAQVSRQDTMERSAGAAVAASGAGAAEFDRYSENYSAGMEHPLKRLLGATAEAFLEPKVRWLLRQLSGPLKPSGRPLEDCRLLDFGCGTGLFLETLYAAGFTGRARGCDISAGMLAEAGRRTLPSALAGFDLVEHLRWPYDDASFDAVTICAVLHHVDPSERDRLFEQARRVLKPGGYLFVFEHNPFNPVTRLVVAQTPIDQNAILLTPREVRQRLRRSDLACVSTRYTMFAPPRLPGIERCEWLLGWLPLGGQYVVTGRKPVDHRPRKSR